MVPIADKVVRSFIAIFIAIDPIGLAGVYLAMGLNVPADRRRRTAQQAVWTGGGVALLFLFLGASIFKTLGITVSDFQIAGGLILLILAACDLVQSAVIEPAKPTDDFGVVPLGMPLIAGPALITTLLLLAETLGLPATLIGLAVNLCIVVLTFIFSQQLARMIGSTGLRAISKIISLLLAAIAVSMIRRGWSG